MMLTRFLTDYGEVNLTDAVAQALVGGVRSPDSYKLTVFRRAVTDWLEGVYAAGIDADRVTVRLSQYRKWMRAWPI